MHHSSAPPTRIRVWTSLDSRRSGLANGIATIDLVYAKEPSLFHARNPFAAGGVYEDPATGAAAAALAGYLRDNVEVTLEVFPEMLHTFQMAAGRAPEADRALDKMAEWGRRVLEVAW
jgi:predicted PhzF superfamily epimerase YddE/YHI9